MTLNALFYPQIVCLDEAVLKYMLLNFDKIYFLPNDVHLNPGHTSIVRRFSIYDGVLFAAYGSREDAFYSSMYAAEPPAWDARMRALMDSYAALEEQGICIPLHEERFASATQLHPLVDAAKADLSDPEFVTLCEQYRNPKYLMPSPESLPHATIKGGGMQIRPTAFHGHSGVFGVCSERLNTALHFADIHGLVPVTNHPLYEKLYAAKLKRAVSNPGFLRERGVSDQAAKFTLKVLSWQLFAEVIPRETLLRKSVGSIVTYKAEATELQERYRSYIRMIQAEVSAAAWDSSLHDEVDKLVRKKVLPEIERIEEGKRVLWEKMFGEVIAAAVKRKVTIPLIGATLIPSVSYSELLWYSTVGIAVGAAGLMAELAPKLTELVLEGRRLKRSALFFLLNFRSAR